MAPLRYPSTGRVLNSSQTEYQPEQYKYTGSALEHSQKLLEQFRDIKQYDNSVISRSLSKGSKVSKKALDNTGTDCMFMTFDKDDKLMTLEKRYFET